MKIENLKLKIGLLICLFAYLVLAQTANASTLSLTINPAIIELHALPSSSVKTDFSLKNKGNAPINLSIHFKQFDNSSLPLNAQILDNDNLIESIKLDPSQQKKLTLSIDIPEDTRHTDYYFSILFISENTQIPDDLNVSLQKLGIANNVFLSVGEEKSSNVSLEEFSGRTFLEKGPVPFVVRIKNKGPHFAKTSGEIIIKNMFGQAVGRIDLSGSYVLANSIRSIPSTAWKEDFILGFYTATLNGKSIHFFAFPFYWLILLAIILLLVAIIKARLRKYGSA